MTLTIFASVCCHAANLLFLISYSVKKQHHLRIMSLFAQVVSMGYYVDMSLWQPLAWCVIFTAINAWRLVTLLKEKNEEKDC